MDETEVPKEVVITFRQAVYRRGLVLRKLSQADKMEDLEGEPIQDLQDGLDRAYNLGKLLQELRFWEDMAHLTCPGHQWEVGETYLPTGKAIHHCIICDMVGGEMLWALDYLRESYTLGCHNCDYHSREGGDWVPYGSTKVQTPEWDTCDYPVDEEMDEMLSLGGKGCPYWLGRSEKNVGLFKS